MTRTGWDHGNQESCARERDTSLSSFIFPI